MKKLFPLLFLFVFAKSNAQLGLKVVQFRPTGEWGFALEKRISGELVWIEEFEDPLRFRYGLQYFVGKARMDTFPSTASMNSTVLPSKYVLEKYNILTFSMGLDRWIWEDANKSLYGGVDLIGGAYAHDYYSEIPFVSTTNYSGSDMFGGIRLRLGFELELADSWMLFFDAQRTMVLSKGEMYSYNDLGIGVRYLFY